LKREEEKIRNNKKYLLQQAGSFQREPDNRKNVFRKKSKSLSDPVRMHMKIPRKNVFLAS
jgi:hypothetical protein